MTKYEWEKELRGNLKRLPEAEIARVMDYYNELFEDKVEEGLNEREIVKRFGNPFDVAYKILYDSGAPATGEGRIKPPEPFMPYERDGREEAEKGAYGAANGQETTGIPHTATERTKENGSGNNKEAVSSFFRFVWTRLAIFVPFVICASVLWSLVIAFVAGGFGSILGGAVMLFYSLTYIGSGVFIAVLGTSVAGTGVGVIMATGGLLLLKIAARLTQKYFYMSKHKANAGTGNKERVA